VFFTISDKALAQQMEAVYAGGYYVIQNKVPFRKGDSIFCNSSTMPDRIVLDSTKKMIAKKVSNPFGYVYYEWKRKDGLKTFEDIVISSAAFREVVFYTDSGTIRPDQFNTNNLGEISYFKGLTNPKKRYNAFNSAKQILVQLPQHSVDSVVKRYNISKHKLLPKTEWYTAFNYYESGHLQSTGLLVKGLNDKKQMGQEKQNHSLKDQKPPSNCYTIGEWLYFDEVGKQFYKEILTELKLMR
jgi:hypothetical protein